MMTTAQRARLCGKDRQGECSMQPLQSRNASPRGRRAPARPPQSCTAGAARTTPAARSHGARSPHWPAGGEAWAALCSTSARRSSSGLRSTFALHVLNGQKRNATRRNPRSRPPRCPPRRCAPASPLQAGAAPPGDRWSPQRSRRAAGPARSAQSARGWRRRRAACRPGCRELAPGGRQTAFSEDVRARWAVCEGRVHRVARRRGERAQPARLSPSPMRCSLRRWPPRSEPG